MPAIQTFFDNFTLLADAPNGVTKLRELTLQLAIEGKLVTQNSDDEPASALVRRIAIKKARLVKDKVILPGKRLSPIAESEIPFHIPSNWIWEQLGNAAILIQIGPFGSLLHKSDYVKNGTPLVNPTHIKNEVIVASNDLTIDEKTKARLSHYVMQTGDIVMGRRGEMGKCAIVSENENGWLCGTGSLFIRFTDDLFQPYLLKALTSDYIESCLLEGSVGSTMNNLNQRILTNLLIPLPPLEEQKRIVAKVDELMRLCDELEARQRATRESRVRLNRATLEPLNNAASLAPEEFEQAAARLADNFDTLYDSVDTVTKLRSTILHLAVQGKLVQQDPNHEPAVAMLRRIQVEKERLVKEKRLKGTNLRPTVASDENPFGLPDGWSWARFGDVYFDIEAGWSPQCDRCPAERDQWGVLKVSSVSWDRFKPEENKAIPKDVKPRAGLEVRTGDFLISRANTAELVAKSVVVEETRPKLMLSDKVLRLRFPEYVNKWFFNYFNNSQTARDYYARTASGTSSSMKNISQEGISYLPVAVPPLEEQKRIVAKVNQLMALCEELEAKLRQAEADSEKLMNAAVQHVLASLSQPSKPSLARISA